VRFLRSEFPLDRIKVQVCEKAGLTAGRAWLGAGGQWWFPIPQTEELGRLRRERELEVLRGKIAVIASAHDPEPPARPEGVVLPLGFSGDDAALLAALREHHPGAKAAFFHRHATYVERVITRVIGFDGELSDIVQDVFLNALSSLHTLKNAGALRPWLAQVATLTARKVLRTRSRRRWLRLFVDHEDEKSAERVTSDTDLATLRALAAVYAVLEELPADEHIAFALRYIEGMEIAEVAAACRVSLSTAKRRLQRAERCFIDRAQQRPELGEWLGRGERWKSR
jgi:RNA polymerase sigma-70 factor (ECF subfamily)